MKVPSLRVPHVRAPGKVATLALTGRLQLPASGLLPCSLLLVGPILAWGAGPWTAPKHGSERTALREAAQRGPPAAAPAPGRGTATVTGTS